MGKNSRLKKLARHLLATTCLTAGAAAMADATTVTETISGVGDYGNSFGAVTLLPNGTRTVNGVVGGILTGTDALDFNDYIEIGGLLGGSSFSFSASMSSQNACFGSP